MEAIRVKDKEWQLAGVHYVRTEAMCNGFGVSLEMEFGEDKAGDEYILVLDGIHPVSTCRLHQLDENTGRSDWAFTLDEGDVDPVLGIHYISEVYLNADPDYQGRFTVPALVDLKTKKVVNNDYFHLTLYFETAWKKYHKPGAPDLYPEEFREEIDALNDIIFREVNNGVYKAGFARNQEAYEEAYHMVFNRLDWLEERLADRRYLFGDKITESDVRLYVTLTRFDVAYHNIFRVNKKRLRDYDNLWAYARDLYQTPGFGDTTDFAAIKKHYHIDCNPGNIHQIIAKGPDEEAWLLPHGREKLSEK